MQSSWSESSINHGILEYTFNKKCLWKWFCMYVLQFCALYCWFIDCECVFTQINILHIILQYIRPMELKVSVYCHRPVCVIRGSMKFSLFQYFSLFIEFLSSKCFKNGFLLKFLGKYWLCLYNFVYETESRHSW